MKIPDKVAIIGVGLIGGSIARGLKRTLGNAVSICGMSSTPQRSLTARNKGIIDEAITFGDLKGFEFIILATPISVTTDLLKKIPAFVKRKCLVIDVGSVKQILDKPVQKLPENIHFVGTHPMAGKERGGFENSDPYLFMNKPWIICPVKKNSKEDLDIVRELVRLLGSKEIILSTLNHDQIVSFSSHLPLVVSSLLIKVAKKSPCFNMVQKTASTGFRDITRLASHDAHLKTDILLANKTNIISSLNKVKEEIDLLTGFMETGRKESLYRYFTQAKEMRDNWLEKYFN